MNKKIVLLTASLLAFVPLTQATIFLVDFRWSGESDIPDANTVNPFTSGSNQPAAFKDNITLTATNGVDQLTLGSFSASAADGSDPLSFDRSQLNSDEDSATRPAWATADAARTMPSIVGGSGTLITLSYTISGLTPNVPVEVSMISSWMNDSGGNTSWNISINGMTSGDSASFNGFTNGRVDGSTVIPYANLTWPEPVGLTANGDGELNFVMTTEDRRISLNAMEITVIPEPSVYALLFGAGALGFVLLRRRMRR